MNNNEKASKVRTTELLCDALPLTAPEREGTTRNSRGFTLIEVLIVCAVLAVLAAIVVPSFPLFQNKARNARAMSELRTLEKSIMAYFADRGTFPADLNAVGYGDLRDPWGNLYQYGPPGTRTIVANPLNSDFDLWSTGRDGTWAPSIAPSNPTSQDDIIRTGEGGWVGLVSTF